MKIEEKHTPFSRKVFGSEHERNKEENRERHIMNIMITKERVEEGKSKQIIDKGI